MTEQEKQLADTLLGQIETATGAFPDRRGEHAALIAEILQSVNGLRSLLGLVRTH